MSLAREPMIYDPLVRCLAKVPPPTLLDLGLRVGRLIRRQHQTTTACRLSSVTSMSPNPLPLSTAWSRAARLEGSVRTWSRYECRVVTLRLGSQLNHNLYSTLKNVVYISDVILKPLSDYTYIHAQYSKWCHKLWLSGNPVLIFYSITQHEYFIVVVVSCVF